GCDVQIFVNDIDMTDKVCDVGADDDFNKPLPREIVLKQFELIERFHGYAGDLETAPPAVRSFIKLIVYKRLCDAYDGVQESSPFVEATEDTEVDDEATDEEVTKETAPAPVTTFVASEVTVSETHTETVSSTQEAQETNSSAQTTVTTETTSESSSISLTTTTSEGEIVPTVP
ncbi:hypothetical protein IT409_00665, partial [Candidatus Falkowbacteria bacterium]|nr:hypothetical protein [Candidatus Falkowbacteria bacterium]